MTNDERPTNDQPAAPDEDPFWYKDAVIYQAHVKSFFDSNNDGIGDFQGLHHKLDYLQSLGITCLWLAFAAFGSGGTQATPRREATLPAAILFMFVIVSAAVTALGEEGGLRGFMQTPLEQLLGPSAAIAMTAATFVLIHASRGLPVLVSMGPFYLATGVVYGLLAYLTQSILPALALHFLGDVLTFSLRSSLFPLPLPHTSAGIALCAVGAVIAGGLSVVSFRRLAEVSASQRIARRSAPAV